jgi:hypothetical protein
LDGSFMRREQKDWIPFCLPLLTLELPCKETPVRGLRAVATLTLHPASAKHQILPIAPTVNWKKIEDWSLPQVLR